MKQHIDLGTLLSQAKDKDEKIASFALLSLGIIESLVGGAIEIQTYQNKKGEWVERAGRLRLQILPSASAETFAGESKIKSRGI